MKDEGEQGKGGLPSPGNLCQIELHASSVAQRLEGDRPMSATITIDEAQANLKELIHQLARGKRSSSPRTSSRWRSW